MPEKALTEKAGQDASEGKHLWPSIGSFARENPDDFQESSKTASATGVQMGRTQSVCDGFTVAFRGC
ncbi:MAG: hypothetical protein WBG54_13720 [Acidobacteriaceae bacterium]